MVSNKLQTAIFDPRAGAKNGQLAHDGVDIVHKNISLQLLPKIEHIVVVVVNNKLREDAVTDHCRTMWRYYMTCKIS